MASGFFTFSSASFLWFRSVQLPLSPLVPALSAPTGAALVCRLGLVLPEHFALVFDRQVFYRSAALRLLWLDLASAHPFAVAADLVAVVATAGFLDSISAARLASAVADLVAAVAFARPVFVGLAFDRFADLAFGLEVAAAAALA